jgi:hypothetical protein
MFLIRNGLKQGAALSPLLLNFALEYVIRKFQVNQDGLKLNGTHQLLVYAHDINKMGGSIHITKKYAETLAVASKEIGLEANADKAKYMVKSRYQNAGRSHNIKIHNTSFERLHEFNYLETTLTNQNPIPEEIKSTMKSGNACYHSAQKLLYSSLLSKNNDYIHSFSSLSYDRSKVSSKPSPPDSAI